MRLLILIFVLTASGAFAQNSTRLIFVGDVKDAATGEPLAYATIGTRHHVDQAVSDAAGKFELSVPSSAHNDTLVVTYVGYEQFQKAIPQLASVEHVMLKEYTTVLDEVRIVHRQLDLREIDREVRVIRGNLHAMDHEVTNIEYNDFLSWLEDYNKMDLKNQHDFRLAGYGKSVQEFYTRYHKASAEKPKRRNRHSVDSITNYNDFPAVNISHESAVEYCKWLTELYNESPKKKRYKKVIFRLPTLKEWQIAALGDSKFQSWELRENLVDIVVPKDTNEMMKGERKRVKVDDAVLYPWYAVYFRDRVYNQFGCYLGNFKIMTDRNCPSRAQAYDGYTMAAHVECYFPNNIGLYDVVGNVAEMIDEKGKACGGSWNDLPRESTIHSVKNFAGPDETVGFRVFMEVIEP